MTVGIIGEAREVPQSWSEWLMGLLGRPFNAVSEFSQGMAQQEGGWRDPIGAVINAPYQIANAFTEAPGKALQEASEGMPLTSDAGGFPPDSPLSFLNQRVNERGAGVIDAAGILAPVASRVGYAAAKTAKAIPEIAMDAYGPQRSASWMFLTKDAQKADMDKLARAFEMEQNGTDPKDIWSATGWFRAPWDGQWRFEIDDSKARQSMARYPRGTTLGKYWKHPELYENHPELANVRVWPGTAEPGTGSYTADDLFGIDRINTPRQADPSITSHETQHGVQRLSGTAFGGGETTAWSDPQLAKVAEEEAQRLWDFSVEKLREKGRMDLLENASIDQLRGIAAEIKRMAGERIYPRLAGEAEARLTQARLGMNAEQRAQSFPLDHMREMLTAEQGGGPGKLYGIEDLIPRYVSRPGDLRLQMPQLSWMDEPAGAGGLLDTAEIAKPKRGWKFGDEIEGDTPAPGIIDDLLSGRPVSREALDQFEKDAKKAGNPPEWIAAGRKRMEDLGDEASAAAHTAANDTAQVGDFVDDVVVRIGVLNTPALDGERFKRVRAVMEAVERGDKYIDVPKLGSMMPGETVRIDIPKEIRGKKTREFYNVPINDPILRKPKPADFNYPIVVTGNPHLTNFIRPDPSWDEVIKTVRVKPVFQGNEKVNSAIAKAINYAHEIKARPLVTTFRDNSLWRLNRYTSLLPTDPSDPQFATYWKKNPKPPPEDKNMRPHYSEYQPTEATKQAFRNAGWDTAKNIKEVHATGSEWYPRSREMGEGILSKVKDKDGPIEYCDALGGGCTSCRNCAKTTQAKPSHQSPIVGCTDEPWCTNACPGCFVPRATKGNTKGREKIALGTNVKQGGYGKADLGDTYRESVNVLQGAMRSQDAPVNYMARFLQLDPAGQADLASSLYMSGLIGQPEYKTMLGEIRKAGGLLDEPARQRMPVEQAMSKPTKQVPYDPFLASDDPGDGWQFSRTMRNAGSNREWTVQVDAKGKERYISYVDGKEIIRYSRPKN